MFKLEHVAIVGGVLGVGYLTYEYVSKRNAQNAADTAAQNYYDNAAGISTAYENTGLSSPAVSASSSTVANTAPSTVQNTAANVSTLLPTAPASPAVVSTPIDPNLIAASQAAYEAPNISDYIDSISNPGVMAPSAAHAQDNTANAPAAAPAQNLQIKAIPI